MDLRYSGVIRRAKLDTLAYEMIPSTLAMKKLVYPFDKFPTDGICLSPEMKSTDVSRWLLTETN